MFLRLGDPLMCLAGKMMMQAAIESHPLLRAPSLNGTFLIDDICMSLLYPACLF